MGMSHVRDKLSPVLVEGRGQFQSLDHSLAVSDDVALEGSSQEVRVGGGGSEGGRGGNKGGEEHLLLWRTRGRTRGRRRLKENRESM